MECRVFHFEVTKSGHSPRPWKKTKERGPEKRKIHLLHLVSVSNSKATSTQFHFALTCHTTPNNQGKPDAKNKNKRTPSFTHNHPRSSFAWHVHTFFCTQQSIIIQHRRRQHNHNNIRKSHELHRRNIIVVFFVISGGTDGTSFLPQFSSPPRRRPVVV